MHKKQLERVEELWEDVRLQRRPDCRPDYCIFICPSGIFFYDDPWNHPCNRGDGNCDKCFLESWEDLTEKEVKSKVDKIVNQYHKTIKLKKIS